MDGKAELVGDVYCDGLGNCLGYCPEDAISIIEKDAASFDEEAVKKHIEKEKSAQSKINVTVPCGCPGAKERVIEKKHSNDSPCRETESELRNWPVQLNLLMPKAPFLNNSNLLICADCAGFAYSNFHEKILRDKTLAIGCPKLDNIEDYKEKILAIIQNNELKSITVAIMEVPCCSNLYKIVEEALIKSGKKITLNKVVISIDGRIIA